MATSLATSTEVGREPEPGDYSVSGEYLIEYRLIGRFLMDWDGTDHFEYDTLDDVEVTMPRDRVAWKAMWFWFVFWFGAAGLAYSIVGGAGFARFVLEAVHGINN